MPSDCIRIDRLCRSGGEFAAANNTRTSKKRRSHFFDTPAHDSYHAFFM